MNIDINNIPQELQNLRQWVCWRLEPDKKTDRTTKVPYNPHTGFKASSSNPATWGTLDEALNCVEKYSFSGIGFMFKQGSGIIGIDLDHCHENFKPNDTAADIIAHLPPTCIEV